TEAQVLQEAAAREGSLHRGSSESNGSSTTRLRRACPGGTTTGKLDHAADMPTRLRRACPGGATICGLGKASKSSPRRDEPGGGGSRIALSLSADQSSPRRDEPGGGGRSMRCSRSFRGRCRFALCGNTIERGYNDLLRLTIVLHVNRLVTVRRDDLNRPLARG